MTRYKLLVFDWDGTLIDSASHIVMSLQMAAREVELPEPSADVVKDIIGMPLYKAVSMLFPEASQHTLTHLITHYQRLFFSKQGKSSPLFVQAKSTLLGLRQQEYDLAVATGKSRRGFDMEAKQHGVYDLFVASRCGDEASSKPNPAMLLSIMQELDVAAEQVLMVGDTTYDLEMANAAGVDAVAVSCGSHSTKRLLACQPLIVLPTVHELTAWLNEHTTQ